MIQIVASMEPMVEPISINTNARNESHTSFLNSDSLNLPTAHTYLFRLPLFKAYM